MGAIANVQGIVIVNRLLYWTSYTDCSVTSVGRACCFLCILCGVDTTNYIATVAS